MRPKRIFTALAAAVGATLMMVAATAGPALADTDPTSTFLTIQSSVVAVGLESNFAMSIGVNAPEGNWFIEAGSPATGNIVLCGGDLSSSTGCRMPAGALPVGNYNLIAVYSGTENSSPSASGLSQLSVVAQQPTSTALSLSATSIVFGHEDNEDIQVTVSGDPFNAAQGTTTVLSNGAPLATQCTGVTLFNATSFCTLNASQLQPGTYSLTAGFNGSANFAGSTSGATTLTVLPQQPTTTTLTLTPSSTVILGDELSETFGARVAASGGTPTGTVFVSTGSTSLCGFTLSGGSGSCRLPSASKLSPGTYPLTAAYSGDGTFAGSTDTSQTLIVAKVPTTTGLTLSTPQVAVGSEDAEVFTPQVAPTQGGGTPTGTVTVNVGATGACTVILGDPVKTCHLKPKQLVPGAYQITASYSGDATFAGSTSAPAQTLTVVKKGQAIIAATK